MAKNIISPKPTKAAMALPNWAFFAFLLVIFAIVYPYIFDKKVNLGGDNAGYYALGKALASGAGYTDVFAPEAPAHNHFPPGYPAILSVFMVFTQSIIFLKVVNGFFLLGTVLLLFIVLKRITDNAMLSFVCAALALFNMHLLSYGTILMSEVSFMFFATLAVLIFMNVQTGKPFYKNPNFYILLIISSFAFHIRTAGIALVAGFSLYMLINKKFAMLGAYLGGFGLLALPWMLRSKAVGGSSYLSQLMLKNPYRPEDGAMAIGDWFTRFGNNIIRYLGKELPSSLFPATPVGYAEDGESNILLGIVIVGFVVFGLIKLPKYKWLITGYLLGSFGILLLWPEVWFGVRFVLPLIPFLLFLFIFGIYQLLLFILSKVGVQKLNPLIFGVMIFIFMPQLKALNENSKTNYDQKFKTYFEMGAWANTNLPPDAVICTRKPPLLYLFANRLVVNFANTPDYNAFFEDFDKNGVTHVVLDQLGYSQTGRYLYPAIQDNPERFTMAHQLPNPDTYLLAYNREFGYTGDWLVTEKDGFYTHIKEGIGTMKYPDGSIYTGQWKNNLPEGQGTKHYPDGHEETGIWANGNLITQ